MFREIPHFVHRDSHGVWVMLSTDEAPHLVVGDEEWSPSTTPVFWQIGPKTLRDRDYFLSGEHALGTPVLGAEDYWHHGAELLGQEEGEWQCNLVLLIKATNHVADDLRDAATALDGMFNDDPFALAPGQIAVYQGHPALDDVDF